MSPPILTVEGVEKSYPQGEDERLEVLRGIDLTVEEGECVAVVGPSGAGKSTLLHLLGALDRPSKGKIVFRGDEVSGRSDAQLARFRNRNVGFVFQFHHLLPEFTALENVALPARVGGVNRVEAERRARQLLVDVGLEARLGHRPSQLSGGEQQRVALARALVLDPALVLADEPTGNLDHLKGEVVHRLLIDRNRQKGTTLVVVTHNRELARSLGRIVTLTEGRIVEEERDRT